MIVFDLHCDQGHRFEGWFRSSSDFEEQVTRGLVDCPHCGSAEVNKAPMAPSVGAKGNSRGDTAPVTTSSTKVQPETVSQPVSNAVMPAEVHKAMRELVKAQQKALSQSTWVGKEFAEQSRKMHYGERDHAAIHGQASVEEAKALIEEGVQIASLPFPVLPPDELN